MKFLHVHRRGSYWMLPKSCVSWSFEVQVKVQALVVNVKENNMLTNFTASIMIPTNFGKAPFQKFLTGLLSHMVIWAFVHTCTCMKKPARGPFLQCSA
jgi:hypothetical protein